MLPATTERVQASTPEWINRRIRWETEARIDWYSRHPDKIAERLRALDREWDIERLVETNASLLVLGGVGLAAFRHRRFLLLPALVGGFLLQHALHGWLPPLRAMRKIGFRTAGEINEERVALKALRGDFVAVGQVGESAAAALAAARG